ncbi:MAG: excinuclease ABC subunit UvrC [bacterium]|nr:excinuclease ABC subunit UvrC [bacterium]
MFFDLQEELKKLPEKPGVYLMHDESDEILYVGKAINLKNRVRQYFQSSRNKTEKIRKMVSHIAWFEYVVTDSELEALVLECNLIKEHRPKYNTMLKDDKSYPYIRVTVEEDYPRVLFAWRRGKDKSRYFGPYTNVKAMKDTLDLIHKIFRLRSCSRVLPRDIGKDRACLNYHMKQCMAPCQGYVSKEEYREQIEKVLDFLNGKFGTVLQELEEKMFAASEKMEFEQAMGYRDLMESVKQIAQKQKITSNDRQDRDILAVAKDEMDAVVQVFFVREGRLIGRDHFHLETSLQEEKGQILTSFVKQFYGGTPLIPKELWVQTELEDSELLEQWLSAKRGQKVSIVVPKKGEKEQLVDLARRNAFLVLSQDKEKIKLEEKRTLGAVAELEQLLGLSGLKRLEAFDISNTSGVESVGSMVVYEQGKPKRSDYRKFKIQWVKGPNDYASMREVLLRRFRHGLAEQQESQKERESSSESRFVRFPDLLLMDGGRGQVNVALEVLQELQLNIPVCGMVKDDAHRTRGIYFQNQEIAIDKHSEAFRLVTRIQDEAHRFAIQYHRSLRGKDQVHSILDDISGIGAVRRKALMRNFQSIEAIRAASEEELAAVEGMNRAAAAKVYEFFHTESGGGFP